MAGCGTLQILHISDLHVKNDKSFDLSIVLDPLIDRVGEDKKNDLVPELIVVTGDVAYSGIKAEYDAAETFFDKLLSKTGLEKNRLFIVPGNHDVNRKPYRPTDIPQYDTMKKLNDELENDGYRADLFKGLTAYFDFVKRYCPHQKSAHGDLVPFVERYKTIAGKQICLVGLNSAWMCRKSTDEGKIAIGEYQVVKAMAELKGKGSTDLTISLFHHPLQWLWPDDRKILKTYLKGSMILSGHLHDVEGGISKDLQGDYYTFQAGGAYLGSGSTWPARYQYITLNWEKDEIRLDFRKYNKDDRTWCLDGETGKDGKKVFENAGISSTTKKPKPKKAAKPGKTLPEIPEAYKRWVIDRCKFMDIDRLREGSKVVSVDLPEVYIPLMAMPPHKETQSKKKKEDSLARMKEDKPREIAAIAGENDYLLIRGEAGSGKTTLLKHMAYSLINGENVWGLGGRLPVLVFLKELKALGDTLKKEIPNKSSAETLLGEYVEKVAENGLDRKTIRAYAAAGKILFLVDGLDEIESGFRNFVAAALGEFRTCHHGCKMVLTGRRHGIEGAVTSRFGDRLVDMLDLVDDQIETFIRNWFLWLYGRESITGQKTAERMISELKTHQDIDILKRNPLMLTAMCILYDDEKTLPEQRAELYKKFITHLLTKRFGDDYNRVHRYLKELAHDMFMAGEKGVDGLKAKQILKKYYPDDTQDDLNQRFATIENDSGMMRLESGKYRFSHLTFQEFLTATHMIDKEAADYANPIRDHWDDEGYKEVIELYIGFLSMDNSGMAHRIVKDALMEKDDGEYPRWRLAARALLDIHPKSRQAESVTIAVEKMIEIIGKPGEPKNLADAGESLGWLGDTRDLKEFISINGGRYSLEEIGDVDIEPFEISKYPVTNQWYGEFVKAKGYEKKEFWSKEGRKWLDGTRTKEPYLWNDRKWICPNAPVVGISWYEAHAFCNWLTENLNDGFIYRLPTENEWQAAAAGKEAREYPWGKEWDEKRCNNKNTEIGKISAVGIFRAGNTPEGISVLSGNVVEWTISDYHSRKDFKDFFFDPEMQRLWDEGNFEEFFKKQEEKSRQLPVLRGGSWYSVNPDFFRCSIRYWDDPLVYSYDVGFRCART